MKFLPSLNKKIACLALAIAALAGVASASEINVHVPVTARWGQKMLPAGDYKFNATAFSPFARVSGNGIQANVFVTSMMPQTKGKRGFLKIVNVQGTPTVVAFGSGPQGMTYLFATAKPRTHTRRTPHIDAQGL